MVVVLYLEDNYYPPLEKVDTISDKALLALIADGDERAFETLFETYRDRLFLYFTKVLKSETIAEELVLDVFTKLWLGRTLCQEIQDINAFLFRMARNKAIDFMRHSAVDEKVKQALALQLGINSTEHADQELQVKEFEQLLRQAVGLLSPKQREAWRLSREESMSHAEIAAHMKISKTTVNDHISDAQRFIRKYMAKHLDLAILLVLWRSR